MPNEKVLNEKKAVVDALTQRLQNAVAGVFVDYKGINVLEDTAPRAEMRENNVNYTVIKTLWLVSQSTTSVSVSSTLY